jgi:hypothetical protein
MSETRDNDEIANLATSLRRHLERRQRAGIRLLPKGAPPPARPLVNHQENFSGGAVVDSSTGVAAGSEARTLEALREAIGDCQRCKLCSGRTHLVFGVGDPHAKLMFVGEGPGRDEDLQGEPFVGRAGQLLTDIITKGIGIKREEVYI